MTQMYNQSHEQTDLSPATVRDILVRLDTLLAELQALRREVQNLTQVEGEPPARSLADELYGSLGQGSWEELDTNADIEAMRFAQ